MLCNSIWRGLFPIKNSPAVIGMIHVKPLPGSPKYKNASHDEVIASACAEAEIYKRAQLDGILIENMHDLPYEVGNKVGPEIVAGMTRVATEVKKIAGSVKCGIQILAAANEQALAVAQSSGCEFIRAEGFVFSHIADEGPIHSCAASLLRYRKRIGAEHIAILTDIKKKHRYKRCNSKIFKWPDIENEKASVVNPTRVSANNLRDIEGLVGFKSHVMYSLIHNTHLPILVSSHAITEDINEAETAKAAEFFLSDGVIVTGLSTGHAPQWELVKAVQDCVSIPVLVGSGVTLKNVEYYMNCDGLIVGSYFKKNQKWEMELDESTINMFMENIFRKRK